MSYKRVHPKTDTGGIIAIYQLNIGRPDPASGLAPKRFKLRWGLLWLWVAWSSIAVLT